ncbi:hypothetical protein ES703_38361 [subsurface metagenome]
MRCPAAYGQYAVSIVDAAQGYVARYALYGYFYSKNNSDFLLFKTTSRCGKTIAGCLRLTNFLIQLGDFPL